MNILEVRGLEKSYPDPESDKDLKAVDVISFILEEVQIYGILGPNGAGKTTTCLLYTSPSPRDRTRSRMPSSA